MDETLETATIPQKAVLAPARWTWLRQWEFWVVVVLGAFLRLWQINLTQYLDDQAGLMVLARAAVTHGLIPLTGIPSSIHTLNPPLSIYLLIPSAALTANPLPNAILIALWNILGIALCYIFTLRYFGRSTAFWGTATFATCGAAINYSRFLWQQNYLPTLFILWAITLYLGVVEQRRRWFVANITLLALAVLLHAIAAFLAPVTLVGAFLALRFPRWRSWIVAFAICLFLVLPTLLWEAISHLSDVALFRKYALGSSHIDAKVFYYLYQALGSPDPGLAGSKYPTDALNIIATLLFAIGWIALTIRVARPLRTLLWNRENGLGAAIRLWATALYRGLRASAPWKINLLLWLAVTIPVAAMIRHSSNLFAHYLMVLYPTAFIVSGIGVVDGIQWASQWLRGFNSSLLARGGLALQAAIVLLIIVRSALWLSYPASLTSPSFNAYLPGFNGYGYPLSVLEDGASQLDRAQQQTHASYVEALAPNFPRFLSPTNYIIGGERADRITMQADCLILPPASDTTPWLVTSMLQPSPSSDLLARLSNATTVGALRMTGGPAYPIYAVTGATTLPNTPAITPVTYDDGRGDTLQLVSLFTLPDNALVAGWRIIKTAPTAALQTRYFSVGLNPAITTTCQAQTWQPGATLYTALVNGAQHTDLPISMTTGTSGLDVRYVGSFGFVSDFNSGEASVALKPTA